MVDFQVSVSLPGEGRPTVYTPSFADEQADRGLGEQLAAQRPGGRSRSGAWWRSSVSSDWWCLRQGFKRVNR